MLRLKSILRPDLVRRGLDLLACKKLGLKILKLKPKYAEIYYTRLHGAT